MARLWSAAAAALTALALATSAAPLTWTRLDPADPAAPRPQPRRGGALVLDAPTARLVLFGGIGGASLLNDVWAFHLANRSWAQLPQQPGAPAPEPRHTFVYDIYINATGRGAGLPPGRALVVATGQGAARVLSDVWALDLDAGGWRRLPDAGDVPTERY
ncbi:Tip elongation aberrant protein 1, partial [Tetrabaena socialis]